MTDATTAREALAAVARTRADLRRDLRQCPPWRHALFGLVFALLIGSIAISSTVQFGALPVILAAIIAIKRSDEKRMGVFINGYRKGRTLPVTLGFVGVMIALVAAAMHMRVAQFSDVSKAGLAALAFVIATAFSVVWQKVFAAELAEEAGE